MRNEDGSILLMTTFLLLFIALILLGYLHIIRYKTKMVTLKQHRIRAYFAARAGLSDAVYELKQGHAWQASNPELSDQWHDGGGATLYKTSQQVPALTQFEYPVTVSVTLTGDPDIERVTLNSVSSVQFSPQSSTRYHAHLELEMVRSLFGEINVMSMKEK